MKATEIKNQKWYKIVPKDRINEMDTWEIYTPDKYQKFKPINSGDLELDTNRFWAFFDTGKENGHHKFIAYHITNLFKDTVTSIGEEIKKGFDFNTPIELMTHNSTLDSLVPLAYIEWNDPQTIKSMTTEDIFDKIEMSPQELQATLDNIVETYPKQLLN